MANALGALFGDIASAIREKTGDTATMKPAQFPEKIAAIEAGGGGGSLVATYQQFTATAAKQTVLHNLGTVPICAMVYPKDFASSSAISDELYISFALSSAVGTLLGFGDNNDNYGRYVYWNTSRKTTMRGFHKNPIDGVPSSNVIFSNATSTNISIGGSGNLKSGSVYDLWLIGYKTAE